MTTPLTETRNIGPAMADAFSAVGLTSAEDVRALDCQGPEKATLRAKFDRLVANHKAPAREIVRALDEVGVVIDVRQLTPPDPS